MIDNLFNQINEAHKKIRPQVIETPLIFSHLLSKITGVNIFLKCEHLQHTGSFKFRGATNKIRLLDPHHTNGVLTVSSGNHGQGVALAGKIANIPVTVYATSSASPIKLEAIRSLGAHVVTLNQSALDVELEASHQAKLKNMIFISPYNDSDVIAGQGTIGMELVEQAQQQRLNLAAIFASVGGGGMISGIGTAIQKLSPTTKIIGCWPANSTAMYSSMKAGQIVESPEFDTISDGTAGGIEPDAITFDICQKVINDSQLVSEQEIKDAMRWVAKSDKWMVEGAAGVALASLFKKAHEYQGKDVVVVICGRNIMLDKFIEAVK